MVLKSLWTPPNLVGDRLGIFYLRLFLLSRKVSKLQADIGLGGYHPCRGFHVTNFNISFWRFQYKYTFHHVQIDNPSKTEQQKRHPSGCLLNESDRRGSNPRSRPWQGRALPTTPLSHVFVVYCVLNSAHL